METDIIVVKASLHRILRDPQLVHQYRQVICTINKIVTAAYLLVRYIIVNEYDSDDSFNVDRYITPPFFKESLKALQTRTRVRTQNENTLRYRRIIGRHIEDFCALYRYQLIQLDGNQSNWEGYIATQMCTEYLNNAERHSSRHLRSIINVIFNTKELLRTVRSVDATPVDKQLARAYLADIGSFKDIISNANSFNEVQGRLPELEELGLEFSEGFHLLSHILERISNGVYRQNSLWYELTAAKSVDTLYYLACLNS